MSDEDWESGFAKSVAVYLNGQGIPDLDERGQRVTDDSFVLCFNAHYEPIDFALPAGRIRHGMGAGDRHRRRPERRRRPDTARFRRRQVNVDARSVMVLQAASTSRSDRLGAGYSTSRRTSRRPRGCRRSGRVRGRARSGSRRSSSSSDASSSPPPRRCRAASRGPIVTVALGRHVGHLVAQPLVESLVVFGLDPLLRRVDNLVAVVVAHLVGVEGLRGVERVVVERVACPCLPMLPDASRR